MSSDNRGLVSTDEETKKRVSKSGREAVSQDREHMSEIVKKDGQK